jgi:hypothetical protein
MSDNLIHGDTVSSKDYDNENYKKFCDDMKFAMLECEHYHGRWFYKGPAVIVDDISEAMSQTNVPCQFDNLGLGYIVYPK